MLDLPPVNYTGWKGANSIVADILARKSIYWNELPNYTSKPLGEVYGC